MALITHAGGATVGEAVSSSTGSGFWDVVRDGNNESVTATEFPIVGTELASNTYSIHEGHCQVPCPYIGAQQRATWSVVEFGGDYPYGDGAQGPTTWSFEWRQFSTNPSDNIAYVPGDTFAGKPLLATYPRSASENDMAAGSEALSAIVTGNTSGNNLRLMVGSSDLTNNIFPAEGSGTVRKIRRIYMHSTKFGYGTLSNSTLNGVMNAHVELSDGRQAFIENAGTPTAPNLALKVRTRNGTITTVGTLTVGSGATQWALPAAQQSMTLCVDTADNLYVIGRKGSAPNELLVQGFRMDGASLWTGQGFVSAALPAYGAGINNVAAAYHPVGSGWVAVVVSHTMGAGSIDQVVLCSLKAQVLLGAEAGPALGEAEAVVPNVGERLRKDLVNPSGTCLDIVRLTDTTEGVLATLDNTGANSSVTPKGYRYSVASTGQVTLSAGTSLYYGASLDPEGIIRLLRLPGSSDFLVLLGGTIARYNVAMSRLSDRYITPPAGVPATGPVVYSARTGMVYRYGVDSSRNLIRVAWAVGSSAAATASTVAATVVPSGATVKHISLAARGVDERFVLVRIAYLGGDGTTHGTAYTADTGLNVAPNAPIQASSPSTINAAVANTLSWTFSDPNAGDVQSAYQVQVSNATTGVTAYDSGKVASATGAHVVPGGTLSNGTGYQWRTRTWDALDAEGAWSGQQALATTSTGVVAIVDPANDYPPGLVSSTLTVEWSFSSGTGATQAEYRVAVVRTDTGATIYDTGFVVGSGVTEHTIGGLLSDVDQRIQVTVKDTLAQTSGVGTRLVRPVFSSPLQPSITVTAGEAWVEVAVTNPPNDEGESFPLAQRNDIYRRRAALGAIPAGLYELVGSCGPNSVFADYTAGSNVPYEYYALAVGDPGASASASAPGSLYLAGVWLHDPGDPAGTARQYRYDGESRRSVRIDRAKTELRFAGREDPVFDFGDERSLVLQARVVIPHGEDDWAEQVLAAEQLPVTGQVVHYRDVRGRALYAVVTSFDETDVAEGTEVSITLTRSEYQGV